MTDKIAIITHDAGGSELLAAYVCRLPSEVRRHCVFSLEGPALRVFSRRYPVDSLPMEVAVDQSDWVLCGTGWQSRHEWNAIRRAKIRGKRAVAFLDHWVNYSERFIRDGITAWPDELWVCDEWALARARIELPNVPVLLQENPLLQELHKAMAARKPLLLGNISGLRLLFLGEPIAAHAKRQHGNERFWGYTELDSLLYLLTHIHALPAPVKHIVIRPHPSDEAGRYNVLLNPEGIVPVVLSTNAELLDDILAADWIAGCNTMGLVIALEAQREALCCIPPGGHPCLLPHERIQSLQQMIARSSA